MFQQLTLHDSLYTLSDKQLQQFKQLSKKLVLEDYLATANQLNSTHCYALVLHIWCMLNEMHLNLYIQIDKVIANPINHYILSILRVNKDVESFSGTLTNQKEKMIFAYYLACVSFKWSDHQLLQHAEISAILQNGSKQPFFLAMECLNQEEITSASFFTLQKQIVQLLASKEEQLFTQKIKHAIEQTKQLIEQEKLATT